VPLVTPTKVPPSAGNVAIAWHDVQPLAAAPPTQVPPLQTSFVEQLLPSLHGLLTCA
jgi:hypothetical protein